jgi:hypothetical protein
MLGQHIYAKKCNHCLLRTAEELLIVPADNVLDINDAERLCVNA